MSRKLVGPLLGVVVSVVLSTLGVLVAGLTGGDVAVASILVHAAAGVVLLVTILMRLEELVGPARGRATDLIDRGSP